MRLVWFGLACQHFGAFPMQLKVENACSVDLNFRKRGTLQIAELIRATMNIGGCKIMGNIDVILRSCNPPNTHTHTRTHAPRAHMKAAGSMQKVVETV